MPNMGPDQYELDEGVAGTKEKLYLGGDYYTAAAVYVKENSGDWQVFYICRDYLGSITHITNSSGHVVQQLSYDARIQAFILKFYTILYIGNDNFLNRTISDILDESKIGI